MHPYLLWMTILATPLFGQQTSSIDTYFSNFEALAPAEKWDEILVQGTAALEEAKLEKRPQDEAKICAQLASTCFYKGEYNQTLSYAKRCQKVSEKFKDPTLFLRSLYLESSCYRALAVKNTEEQGQQTFYALAVETGEKAAALYHKRALQNPNLHGKIYFNLGAAHADNPNGDLAKASCCYLIALECFKNAQNTDDTVRIILRLGRVYLLQDNYERTQQCLDDVRPLITKERIAMHTDYLEAQLKFAQKDFAGAQKIAQTGLDRAKVLGAKEDELRLSTLLRTIQNQPQP